MKKFILVFNLILLLSVVCLCELNYQYKDTVILQEAEDVFAFEEMENLPVATEEITNLQYDTYVKNYFAGLTQNFGANIKGSCGYVSLGMLLSYYDSFLDDNIISRAI